MDQAMQAAQAQFDAFDFDDIDVVADRRQEVVNAIADIGVGVVIADRVLNAPRGQNEINVVIADSEREHYRALLTAKRDALNASIQAAQLRFNAHNFDGAEGL